MCFDIATAREVRLRRISWKKIGGCEKGLWVMGMQVQFHNLNTMAFHDVVVIRTKLLGCRRVNCSARGEARHLAAQRKL